MEWSETALTAGLLVLVASIGLTIRQVGRRMRESVRERGARQVEEIADIAAPALAFGGIVLIQISSLVAHMSGSPPTLPWFTVFATMPMVLLFGFQLGRLFMRWQVRRMLAAPANVPPHFS